MPVLGVNAHNHEYLVVERKDEITLFYFTKKSAQKYNNLKIWGSQSGVFKKGCSMTWRSVVR